LGGFISGFRDTARGTAPICMCHAVVARRPEVARFDSLLLSVLSKPAVNAGQEPRLFAGEVAVLMRGGSDRTAPVGLTLL